MNPSSIFDARIFSFFAAAQRGSAGRYRPLRLLEASAFQRRQAVRRRRAAREGLVVPPILIASITRKCNLDCEGCYSRALRPGAGAELPDGRFMELFREAIGLGVGAIFLAGGEPLMRRSLVEEAARLRGVLLPVFTNGTLLDDGLVRLAGRSSIVPILSIEGKASDTDGRRGPGIHRHAEESMAALREIGALFGASITLTSRNADAVLERGFLEGLGRTGIALLFLVEYVPAARGTEGLVLTAEQKAALAALMVSPRLPYPIVDLPGDEASYGGCLAAGRGFIHLAENGRLEACPFAPFSDSDAGASGLREALASPLMRAIRERHAELTEQSGGCALWNKAGWVASIGACTRGDGFLVDDVLAGRTMVQHDAGNPARMAAPRERVRATRQQPPASRSTLSGMARSDRIDGRRQSASAR